MRGYGPHPPSVSKSHQKKDNFGHFETVSKTAKRKRNQHLPSLSRYFISVYSRIWLLGGGDSEARAMRTALGVEHIEKLRQEDLAVRAALCNFLQICQMKSSRPMTVRLFLFLLLHVPNVSPPLKKIAFSVQNGTTEEEECRADPECRQSRHWRRFIYSIHAYSHSKDNETITQASISPQSKCFHDLNVEKRHQIDQTKNRGAFSRHGRGHQHERRRFCTDAHTNAEMYR